MDKVGGTLQLEQFANLNQDHFLSDCRLEQFLSGWETEPDPGTIKKETGGKGAKLKIFQI
jgi:hypothetical protein